MARQRNAVVEEETLNTLNTEEVEDVDLNKVEETEDVPEAETEAEGNGEKKQKKLGKKVNYETNTVTIDVLGGTGTKNYCSDDLPEAVQDKLKPFGLGHKLGDAAAGKTGAAAEEAVEKVWAGLMANDWSVRAPATPKVSLKELQDKFNQMDEAEKTIAAGLFAKLGIKF